MAEAGGEDDRDEMGGSAPVTTPRLASDDTAIHAAQDRIRENLEARARACFDVALKRPSLGAVDAVRRALVALHHQWVATLEQESRPVVTELADCQGERPWPPVIACPKCGASGVAFICSERGCPVNGGAARPSMLDAQSDFGRNPAPLTTNAGQERRPVPCVPRHSTGEGA